LAEKDADGNDYWAFGGDYGPKGTPSSGDFNCNGVVLPDRSPKAHAEEMRKVYQNIWFKNFDAQKARSTFTTKISLSTSVNITSNMK